MPIYIALLRGINVGGKNKIQMSELKKETEALGYARVRTYINSGNLLFEATAEEESEEHLRARLEAMIREKFGITLTVVLRTAEEWERILLECPYREEDLPEAGSLQLSLLLESPTERQLEHLRRNQSTLDEFQVRGREIYFRLGQSMMDSKLMDNLSKLKDSVTTRNWNTVKKLAAMLEETKSGK